MKRNHVPNPSGVGLTPNYSTWRNSKTKPIRVPEILSAQVMEYAHQLDRGITEQTDREDIEQAIAILEDCLDNKKYPSNKGGAIKRKIKEALGYLSI